LSGRDVGDFGSGKAGGLRQFSFHFVRIPLA
jgi:hypothetical protein